MLKYSSSQSRSMWKKRYFVLRGNNLAYYDNHEMGESKADVFLLAETEVKPCEIDDQLCCISLSIPFSSIQLAALSLADQSSWIDAFETAISNAKSALRGSYFKLSNSGDTQRKKKFFILHEMAIGLYKDEQHLVINYSIPDNSNNWP